MKKITLSITLIFSIILLVLKINSVNAQLIGTFDCEYLAPNCNTDPASISCSEGYCVDWLYCPYYSFNPSGCGSQVGISCIPCLPTLTPAPEVDCVAEGLYWGTPGICQAGECDSILETGCTYTPFNDCCNTSAPFCCIEIPDEPSVDCYGEGVYEDIPGTCEWGEYGVCPDPLVVGCTNEGPFDDCCNFLAPLCCVVDPAAPPPPPPSGPIDWSQLYDALNWRFGESPTTGSIINILVSLLFSIAGLLLLLYLIYGGFMFLTSGGDPNKAQVAKGIITTALIGFIIIFTSYWIVQIAGRVLGLQEITDIF